MKIIIFLSLLGLSLTVIAQENPVVELPPKHNVLPITAYDYAFNAPMEARSGWARIELNNQRAEEIHEVTFVRLPDGISYQTYLDDFIAPWMEIWHGMKSGVVHDDNFQRIASENLPSWTNQLNYRHARSIVSPGKQAAAYAYLPEGTYAVECWLKTADGHIHIAHGMIREMKVVSERSQLEPPKSGIPLHISQGQIDMPKTVTVGQHTFIASVDSNERGGPVHPDLHLIRLDEDTQIRQIVEWLDWYNLDGLTSPAPAIFLGGYSTYGSALIDGKIAFEITISAPGDYAWVIQSSADDPIWHSFSVAHE